jgi:cysteine sulfinate desulfinase/cysteine desulfurase-like protein
MGLPESRVLSSLRISLGWGTTEADVDRCAEALHTHARRLRSVPAQRRAAP